MINLADIIFDILLILGNAIFVITEFTLLRVNKTRVKELFEEKKFGANFLDQIFENLNIHVYTAQFGIAVMTISYSIVSWRLYRETIITTQFSTVQKYLFDALFLFLIFFIYMVFAEIIPKIIAIQRIDQVALMIAPFIYSITRIFKIIPVTIREFSILVLKLFRINTVKHVYTPTYSEEELKSIIAQSKEQGEIDASEQFLINNVLNFTDKTAREIMTPRHEIVAFEISAKISDVLEKAKESGYSRFPVYDSDLDNLTNFIHIKDVALADSQNLDVKLSDYLRPTISIHEGMQLDNLLKKMQVKKTQMAIVYDEYGSMEGLVTIEDVIEAIVGPINDEFDLSRTKEIQKLDDLTYLIEAKISLESFNQKFHTELESTDAVTLAGFILEQLESVPTETTEFSYKDIKFQISKMEGNRIMLVTVKIPNGIDTNYPSTLSELDDKSDLTEKLT